MSVGFRGAQMVLARPRTVDAMLVPAVVAAVALLMLPFGSFDAVDRRLVIWSTALVLTVLPVSAHMAARRRGAFPWLDPIVLFSGYFAFKYGLGVVVLNYWSEFGWVESPGSATIFERWGIWDFLPIACQLFLLAGLGLYLGARIPSERAAGWLPALKWRIDERRFALNLWIYTPIALALFVVGRRMLPLVIRDTVLLFGWLSWVIVIIAAIRLFSSNSPMRPVWISMIMMIWLAHVVLGFDIGMRGVFIYPALLIGIGYVVARRRIPLFFVTAALGLILAVIPWLSYYKVQPTEAPFLQRANAASLEYAAASWRDVAERGVEAVLGRSVGVTGMAPVFIQYYPELYEWEKGRTFLLEAAQLVPRIFWADKPNLSEELNLYTRRTGMIGADDEVTSAVFDAVTEYYVNFGALGVFVLCLLHGCYFRILHRWLVERSDALIGVPILLVLVFINFDFFGLGASIVSHTRQIPVWGAVLWLLSRHRTISA
jgi:hypothetical protein